MKRALLIWLLSVAITGSLTLAVGVIGNMAQLRSPVLAGMQVAFDATTMVALGYRWFRRRRHPAEAGLLAWLLAAYVASTLFTVTYQWYATILGQQFPTWTIGPWIAFLLCLIGFWGQALAPHFGRQAADAVAARRLVLVIFVSLTCAHALHLSDLFGYQGMEGYRRGVYGLSGVVEAVAAVTLSVAAMMYRKLSWIQSLVLLQLALIQLDLVFCSVEFNGKLDQFVAWPWEAMWAACQGLVAWLVIRRLGDLSPFLPDDAARPPRNILRGPTAGVVTGAGIALALLTYYVTSGNPWHDEPMLRGQGVALSVAVFILFMVFVVPHLVFDDGPLDKGSAAERASSIINNFFGSITVGDIISNNQGVVVNRSSNVSHVTANTLWQGLQPQIDLPALANELARLRAEMRQHSQEASADRAVGAVASAEEAAREGNGPKALEFLHGAGSWALGVAEKIGVALAASAIKAALALP